MSWSRAACLTMIVIQGCAQQEQANKSTGGSTGHDQLVLEELHVWTAANPSSLRTGGFVNEDQVVVASTDGDLWLYQVGSDRPRLVAALGSALVLVGSDGTTNGAVGEVWTQHGERFRLETDGGLRRLDKCPVAANVVSALRLPQATLVIQRREQGPVNRPTYTAAELTMSGSLCHASDPIPLPCSGPPPSAAAGRGGFAWIACGESPLGLLESHSVEGDTRFRVSERSAPPSHQASAPDLPGLWHAFPLMSLDRGYMRVLSDLRGNRRRFELWDEHGRFLETTVVSAPIAFIASLPTHRLLLGMRAGRAHELVVFQWSWLAEPT